MFGEFDLDTREACSMHFVKSLVRGKMGKDETFKWKEEGNARFKKKEFGKVFDSNTHCIDVFRLDERSIPYSSVENVHQFRAYVSVMERIDWAETKPSGI